MILWLWYKIISKMPSLTRLFHAHGQFCAAHPLEVLVATLTVIMSLMSIGKTTDYRGYGCGWNFLCAKKQKLKETQIIIVSVAKCIALVYTYLQFRSLRRLGSKHLLGISGVFTILSSVIFCIAFAMVFGNTLSGLHEALPFFFFLIDLSKASALAVFALNSTTRDEITRNIAKGIAMLGPAITLDAVTEVLVIGVGTLSGVLQVETMCYFGCLSVVANYFAFMTFYPACLALVLELSQDISQSQSSRKYQQLAAKLWEEHEIKKPNPVTQGVKIIMSAGLAFVHIYSRLIPKSDTSLEPLSDSVQGDTPESEMSWAHYYLYKIFAVHADYGLTLTLGVALVLKYIFVDRHNDLLEVRHAFHLQKAMSSVDMETQTEPIELDEDNVEEDQIRTSFSLGDDEDLDECNTLESKTTQTDMLLKQLLPLRRLPSHQPPRPIGECVQILRSDAGASELTDEEIIRLVESKHIPFYKLEGMLGDYQRGVAIRRMIVDKNLRESGSLETLPYSNYDFSYVDGACCENVVGLVPVPVGVAGPLLLDGKQYTVPMATTEGCLVASTNRGCRALNMGEGVRSCVVGDGMARGPVVRLPSATQASEVKQWLEDPDNYDKIKESFDMTSRFARLQKIHAAQAGRLLYVRFVAKTGDAMGMNMLSKGTEKALHTLQESFPELEILSLSGNFCTDKKPSAVNWIEGRGKSVVCEAVVKADVIKNTLKTSAHTLVELNICKNLVGSAMAGSIGGQNAHAANIVTAIFIATGQDPAQTVTSAYCITLMETTGPNQEDLYISCTMPSIEVGTVGGGTVLPPQAACLQMLGVRGSAENPGENASQLARIICATVLAGELSLMSALSAGHLVRSHLRHNRSSIFKGTSSPMSQPGVSPYTASLYTAIDRQNVKQSDNETTKSESKGQGHEETDKGSINIPQITVSNANVKQSWKHKANTNSNAPVDTRTSVRYRKSSSPKLSTNQNEKPKVATNQIPSSDNVTKDQGEIGTCIKHVS